MKYFKYISFLLSIFLIYFLIKQVDISVLFQTIAKIDVKYYLLALGFYLVTYAIQAYRIKIFYQGVQFSRLAVFILLHKFINRALPLRIGEAFFPVILKKLCGISYDEGIAKLLLIRISDIISIFFIFCIYFFKPDLNHQLIGATSIFIFFAFLIFLIIFIFTLDKTLPKILKALNLFLTENLSKKLNNIATSLQEALAVPKPKIISLISLSIADKLFFCATTYFLMVGLSYNIGFYELVVANAASGITEILPINSIGSFGTTELGWAGALMYFGHSQQEAIASGFSFNLLAFSYTILLGAIGLIPATFVYNLWAKKPTAPALEK